MGWMSESDNHEGYLRGFEPLFPDYSTDTLLREITSSDADKRTIPLKYVCAACECGWRSPRWRPLSFWYDGIGAGARNVPEWTPSIVTASPEDEEIGRILWAEHDRACRVDPVVEARVLARARLGWPADGARISFIGQDEIQRSARVISSHMADSSGRNLQIRLEDGEAPDPANPTTRNREAWIRSSAILALDPPGRSPR